jgi:integrase
LPRAPSTQLRRKRVPIAGSEAMTRAQATREGKRIAADVLAGRIVFDEKPQATRVAPSGPASDWSTVRKLGEAWTSGEMFKRFGRVNKLRVKAGAKIDAWTLAAHVYDVKTRGPAGPAFGDLAVADVTSDDVAIVMGAQPSEHRAETRIKQYNRLHRLFELAEFPCRLRREGVNPVRKYLRPEMDPEKLFCFLYPTELVALLGCDRVPLARRVLYALATYTGQRKGSLFALRWRHVDSDHGTLASFKTKTGRAQYFVADRGLMVLLAAWRELQGNPADDEPIVRESDIDVKGGPKRIAGVLRADLKRAKVTRAILFEDTAENVESLRFHDLRSTFCTWARRAGKSDAWISERTGHDLDGKMISRYDRGAQTLADLDYAPFPGIANAVPELRVCPSRALSCAASAACAMPRAERAARLSIDVRLATTLATGLGPQKVETSETRIVSEAWVVGAIGIEPTTPTVSR